MLDSHNSNCNIRHNHHIHRSLRHIRHRHQNFQTKKTQKNQERPSIKAMHTGGFSFWISGVKKGKSKSLEDGNSIQADWTSFLLPIVLKYNYYWLCYMNRQNTPSRWLKERKYSDEPQIICPTTIRLVSLFFIFLVNFRPLELIIIPSGCCHPTPIWEDRTRRWVK